MKGKGAAYNNCSSSAHQRDFFNVRTARAVCLDKLL